MYTTGIGPPSATSHVAFWAAVSWVAFIQSVACAPGKLEVLAIAMSRDEVVVGAIVSASDRVVHVARLEPGVIPSAELGAEEGDRLLVWFLGPSDFVDRYGAPLTQDVRGQITVALRETEPAANAVGDRCDRCLYPASAPPQLAFPGMSCPPPAYVRTKAFRFGRAGEVGELFGTDSKPEPEISREAAARYGEAVRVAFPGACPTMPAPPDPEERLVACPLLPADSPRAFSVAAIASDGTVGAFDAFGGARATANGQSTQVASPFRGPVLGVFALPTGGFLVHSGDFDRPLDHVEYTQFSSEILPTPLFGLDVFANTMVSLDGGDDVHLVGFRRGAFRLRIPTITQCDASELARGSISCADAPIEEDDPSCGWTKDSIALSYAGSTPRGVALVTSGSAHLLLRSSPGSLWRCDRNNDAVYPLQGSPGSRVTVHRFQQIGVLGERFFLCGYRTVEEGGGTVVATTPADGDVLSLPWTIVDAPSDACAGFAKIPETGGLLLQLRNGGGIEFAQDGSVRRRFQSVVQELYPRLAALGDASFELETEPSGSGWQLAHGSGRGFYRRAPGASAFERVFGSTTHREGSRLLHAQNDGSIVAFLAGETPVAIRRTSADGCAGLSSEEIPLSGDLAEVGGSLDAVALDSATSDDAFLLAGNRRGVSASTPPRFWTVELGEGARVVEEIAPDGVLSGRRVHAMEELVPGLHVVLSDDGSLAELRDDRVTSLELEVDDPAKPSAESAPTSQPFLRVLGARDGVAWAAGDGALVRIAAVGAFGRARAEAFWLDRVRSSPFDAIPRVAPPRVVAISVLAPDLVVLAVQDRMATVEARGVRDLDTLWLLQPAHLPCAALGGAALGPFGELRLCPLPDGAQSDAAPRAIVGGASGDITLVGQFGDRQAVARRGSQILALPFWKPTSAVLGSRMVVVSGEAGHVAGVLLDRP